MEEVTVFRTSDGSVFNEAAEATAHEKTLERSKLIEVWITEQDLPKASATRARNAILDYLSWVDER